MCGIAGYFNSITSTRDLLNMGQSLRHRGPNDQGLWEARAPRIGLVHQRLSILDTSKAGHQPMVSSCGRFVLAYNGEIYNFTDLNHALQSKGIRVKSSCDTETLLCSIQCYGIEHTLESINGMFAFALWDKKEKQLTLARDRVGIKPLYYHLSNNQLLFASELRALEVGSPKANFAISTPALARFLEYRYLSEDTCIFQDVHKIHPGTYQQFHLKSTSLHQKVHSYWSFERITQESRTGTIPKERNQELVEHSLKQAVEKRMVSDVPIGAFLSGGIDSSLITAIMQSLASRPIKTFCIGFDNPDYNEAGYAKRIAQHLGTDHTELYLRAQDLQSIIPELPTIYSEPFADESQIPTLLLSKFAKSSVTVCLSGDGGDEIFAGYQRYFKTRMLNSCFSFLPHQLRITVSSLMQTLPIQRILSLLPLIENIFSKHSKLSLEDKTRRVIQLLSCSLGDIYQSMLTTRFPPNELLLETSDLNRNLLDRYLSPSLHPIESMMLTDSLSYLPGDILVKVDRASMANSLEVRVPFLDHEVIEQAWQLPLSSKVQKNKGKLVLRSILQRYVPAPLFERPKMGFGIPIGDWLTGPLKEWASDLLSQDRLKRQKIFQPQAIEALWKGHLSGSYNNVSILWTILMFQAWLETRPTSLFQTPGAIQVNHSTLKKPAHTQHTATL